MEQITDTLGMAQQNVTVNAPSASFWTLWNVVAIVAAVLLLLVLVLYFLRDKKKSRVKAKVMNETADVNFSSFNNDWKKTERLYDELKRKCHPDLFHDDRNEVATFLFQRLTENKFRYAELLKIREEAIEKLGIKVDARQ